MPVLTTLPMMLMNAGISGSLICAGAVGIAACAGVLGNCGRRVCGPATGEAWVAEVIGCDITPGAEILGEGVGETEAEGLDGRVGGNIGLDGCAR